MNSTHNVSSPGPEPQTFRVINIQIQFLTTPDQIGSDMSVMRVVVPSGTIIPLHKHADPELFYVLGGTVEAFQGDTDQEHWRTFHAGETISIPGGIKHAVRNISAMSASCLVVTKTELYSFFLSLAQPVTGDEQVSPPTPSEMRELFDMAERYGYWLATPEENIAIGISMAEV